MPANGGGTQGASAAAAGHKSADEMLDELLEDLKEDEKEPAAVAVKSVRVLKALELVVLWLGFRRSSEGGWPTPLRR